MTTDPYRLQQAFDEAELHAWRGQELALTVRVGQTWVEQAAGWRLAGLQFSSLGEN